jgi:hypothetical protein
MSRSVPEKCLTQTSDHVAAKFRVGCHAAERKLEVDDSSESQNADRQHFEYFVSR